MEALQRQGLGSRHRCKTNRRCVKMKLSLLAVLALPLALAAPNKRASSFVCTCTLVPCLEGYSANSTGFGSNESGAEFGQGNIPGVLGKDYIWPDASAIATLHSAGMNIFRVAFMMERLVPSTMTGAADATYMGDLKAVSRVERV